MQSAGSMSGNGVEYGARTYGPGRMETGGVVGSNAVEVGGGAGSVGRSASRTYAGGSDGRRRVLGPELRIRDGVDSPDHDDRGDRRGDREIAHQPPPTEVRWQAPRR